FIGSGADIDNIGTLMKAADGVIVASSLKRQGDINQPIDPIRVGQFVEAMQESLQALEGTLPLPTVMTS
ncbi:phosphorybosylanthranilate isomerase, partial [filamentous cyanobacterium CCP4]